MIKAIKSFAQKLPIVPSVYEAYVDHRRKRMSTEEIFTEILENNAWKGANSASGPGSDLDQTKTLIEELPLLLSKLGVSTMLDVPCGDFYWMKFLDLKNTKYIGADIVRELICQNKKYESRKISFVHADLLRDELPRADLVLCRDCLVHFSFADIDRALRNIRRSSSEYLLTTTYPDICQNSDIITGGWRALNLQLEPFNLPAPLHVIVEGCTERSGTVRDKSLGLWKVKDI